MGGVAGAVARSRGHFFEYVEMIINYLRIRVFSRSEIALGNLFVYDRPASSR
jgi:hypothetical protein